MEFILNLWEIIQNLLGWLEVKFNNPTFAHSFGDTKIYYMTYDDSHCIGKYIFINKESDEHTIIRHEYGHRIQSRMLGPLYMLVIYIPSYLHFVFWMLYHEYDWTEYYDFYTERWADRLSKKRK